MDYAEMNQGSWATYLVRFKDLLRPEGVAPMGELDERVESARGDSSARSSLATITDALPDLVFEGYTDWYTYDEEWVLRNLGHVLSAEEEDEILRRLDQGTPESLGEVLRYVADERLTVWQNLAREEFADAASDDARILTGAANTANWQASRTPATYYTYSDDRYLYSDLPEGPADEWETLPVREQLATENAMPWGSEGWFYTPTGEPGLYGGDFVYAPDRDGPWLTKDQAQSQIDASALAEPAAARRYNPVEPVAGHDGWACGYDTQDEGWKFAQMNGSEAPGDDATWTAINTFRANDTEYFAGPGHSDSGWVPYTETVTDPTQAEPDTAVGAQAEQVSAQQRQVAVQTVRESVVGPALSQVVSQLREKLPPDLVAQLGPKLENLAERLVVAQTAELLVTREPAGA